ncbi:hypothetical protein NEOKW01_0048 [Nematocida sp. AWRm80]|nr:hypothetical protein NEOKW01_0048 [Nematocida sp. AWRm80]
MYSTISETNNIYSAVKLSNLAEILPSIPDSLDPNYTVYDYESALISILAGTRCSSYIENPDGQDNLPVINWIDNNWSAVLNSIISSPQASNDIAVLFEKYKNIILATGIDKNEKIDEYKRDLTNYIVLHLDNIYKGYIQVSTLGDMYLELLNKKTTVVSGASPGHINTLESRFTSILSSQSLIWSSATVPLKNTDLYSVSELYQLKWVLDPNITLSSRIEDLFKKVSEIPSVNNCTPEELLNYKELVSIITHYNHLAPLEYLLRSVSNSSADFISLFASNPLDLFYFINEFYALDESEKKQKIIEMFKKNSELFSKDIFDKFKTTEIDNLPYLQSLPKKTQDSIFLSRYKSITNYLNISPNGTASIYPKDWFSRQLLITKIIIILLFLAVLIALTVFIIHILSDPNANEYYSF